MSDIVYLVMEAEPQDDGFFIYQWVRFAYLNQRNAAHRMARTLTFNHKNQTHENGMPCFEFWVTQKKIHKEDKP